MMRRFGLLLLGCAAAGCAASGKTVGATSGNTVGAARPAVQQDVEGYAIAACLANQSQPYLKDQGDAWASVIVQRMKGEVEVLADIAEQVKRETAKGAMAVIRNEAGPGEDKILPVLYCEEIIDKPGVRAAIQKAIVALGPHYRR